MVHRAPHNCKSLQSGIWITIKPCQNHPCTLYCTVHSLANSSLHSGIWITIKSCKNHTCTLQCTVLHIVHCTVVSESPSSLARITLDPTVHSCAHSSPHSGMRITFSSCQVIHATDWLNLTLHNCTVVYTSLMATAQRCIFHRVLSQWYICILTT